MLELNFSQTLGNHCLTINETLPANGITAIFGVSGATVKTKNKKMGK